MVFGHVGSGEDLRIIPLYVPKVQRERVARIFLFKKGENSHYCVVRSMSRLISAQVRSDHGEIYVRDYCLNYFCKQEKLDKHTESCSKHDVVNTIFPEPGKNILKFKNIQNCVECPIKIYADTETFLSPIDEKRGETELYQRHVMSTFCFYVVSRVKGFSMDPVTYVMESEDDEVERIFMEKLEEVTKEIYETSRISAKRIFDEDARRLYESLTECYACGKEFDGDKVRDHCHYTGKYRGALHSQCNLRLRRTRTIPVIFHNLSEYDSHHFVRRLADTVGRVDCIPQNAEKYITFNKNVHVDTIVRDEKEIKVYTRLKFVDLFRFMQTSLTSFVRNIDKFDHTSRYFEAEQQELFRRKEVYPYEYMTDFSKFAETELPLKEEFNKWLNSGAVSKSGKFDEMDPEKISDEDYAHAKGLWDAFECKNLADYTKIYCKIDTLQLTDVFENFFDVCLEKYKLDPSYYLTSAALAWDGMLKVTGVKMELLTDPDMYLFFEEGIRGGVSSAMKRYSKANNAYMRDYDPKKPDVFIQYLDKNSLYATMLCKPLPVWKFTWLTEEEIGEMMKDPTKIMSCTLKVDLEYPKGLHDAHNDYVPLAPESVTVDGVEKLIPNLRDKERYVVHHESATVLPEERNSFEEDSRRNFVRGARLHEEIHRN